MLARFTIKYYDDYIIHYFMIKNFPSHYASLAPVSMAGLLSRLHFGRHDDATRRTIAPRHGHFYAASSLIAFLMLMPLLRQAKSMSSHEMH